MEETTEQITDEVKEFITREVNRQIRVYANSFLTFLAVLEELSKRCQDKLQGGDGDE